VTYRSNGPGTIIVNIILCSDVCFTHVTTINNLLTYLYIKYAHILIPQKHNITVKQTNSYNLPIQMVQSSN